MYPFERFTEGAQRVLSLAQQEAAGVGAAYIGTEHLALALCRDDGVAGTALANLGVTHELLRKRIGDVLKRPVGRGYTAIIPTSRVQKIVEMAFHEATVGGSNLVASEHLLLALVVEAEGVGAHALDELGATLPKIRHAVRSVSSSQHAGPEPGGALGTSSWLGLALLQAGQLARDEGALDIRPDHLLRAMAESQILELTGVLQKVGVVPADVADRLKVPDEVRQLGMEVFRARQRTRDVPVAVEDIANLNRQYLDAVSRWLGTASAADK